MTMKRNESGVRNMGIYNGKLKVTEAAPKPLITTLESPSHLPKNKIQFFPFQ